MPASPTNGFADDQQLKSMLLDNSLLEYYKKLKMDYKINYDELATTARGLKTLDKDMLKEAIRYFSRSEDEHSSDSSSSG